MKELSIEEKAKRYDEAIERAKNTIEVYQTIPDIVECVESLFPELKESEDERIRKKLIEAVKRDMVVGGTKDKQLALAWLEKQSEQKANVVVRRFLIGDTFIDKYYPTNVFTVTEYIENGIAYVDQSGERFTKYYDDSWDDYQLIEQKATDKVEPKFKVGDAIRLKNSNAEYIIESISDGHYYGKGFSISIVGGNRDYELVEQKPKEYAKGEDYGIDGLYNAIRILQKTLGKVDGYQTDDGILEHECAISAVKSLYEQKPTGWSEKLIADVFEMVGLAKIVREQENDALTRSLQSAMIELAKYSVVPQIRQEWSEEDEKQARQIERIVHDDGCTQKLQKQIADWLKALKDRVQPQPKQEWSEQDEENFARVDYACLKVYGGDSYSSDWLRKFLGIHKKWKPSDEQMDAMQKALVNLCGKDEHNIITGLYYDLKKL